MEAALGTALAPAEFESQYPRGNLGTVACSCYPSTGDTTGRPVGLTGQPAQLESSDPVSERQNGAGNMG